MTRIRYTTPVFIVLLLIVSFTAVSKITYSEKDSSWGDYVVIGDAFQTAFFLDRVPGLVEDYGLEALHNSVGAWIDYREWMRYPAEWDVNIARLIRGAHSFGVPIGVTFGYHVGDSVTAPYTAEVGFLHYYRAVLPLDSKLRYPNGTIAEDPYSVGSSRSFSGY